MKLKYVSSLAAIISSLFFYDSVYANGCNDFTVYVDNRTQESLYVTHQTPNGSTEGQRLSPGSNFLAKSFNTDNRHNDTWASVKIFKADKKSPIFEGTLVKNKLEVGRKDPTEGTDIYVKRYLIQDGNYTIQGSITSKGYCNQPEGRDTNGSWRYTILKD